MSEKPMATESTPLITTVQVGPPRYRYPHHTVRRFCTIALSSSLVALLVTFAVTLVFGPARHGHHRHDGGGLDSDRLSWDDLKDILLETPDSRKAEEWLRYYTAGPHLAGKNLSQAEWTSDRWNEWGVKSDVVAYDVYINYPKDHRLALLEKSKSKSNSSLKVAFEASLTEDVLEEDPTTSLPDQIPTFHGYSASGNVTAPFVYVNYGTYQDFEDLVKANVSLEGKIAIARYGGIFRGLKVKRAEELGLVGVVLYSDPGDDGDVTDEKGVEQYPKGPARNPSSVQRGSVEYLSVAPGDPTTPGYPSKPGVPREPVEGKIPSIPSIPISYKDALPILKSLNGHGPKAKDFNKYWNRNLGLEYKGYDYSVGPSPDDLVLNLYNDVEYETTPLWNVIGVINGTIPDEVVIIGNHRDAWIAGGAVDPNSGSAVINEAIRSFGKALEQGWKPLRTIVFASWDGEEYGLIGSTEWVEEFLPWVSATGVAYVNVDVGVSGTAFSAAASPLLNKLLYDVTPLIPSPNQTIPGQTVGDLWDGHISIMGSGSDFTAFQDFAGVPSLDFRFESADDAAVYHYHSIYDSFYWMATFGDPGFIYHKTMSQVLALTVAKLSETPLVTLNATDYADALKGYVKQIESKLAPADEEPATENEIFALRARPVRDDVKGDPEAFRLSLDRLYKSVDAYKRAAVKLDARAARLAEEANEHIPWWKWIHKIKLIKDIRAVNTKYKLIERAFLYQPGLDSRSWFKHVVFAPGLWTGYAGAVFPGLVESIDDKDYGNALKWVKIIEGRIKQATKTVE